MRLMCTKRLMLIIGATIFLYFPVSTSYCETIDWQNNASMPSNITEHLGHLPPPDNHCPILQTTNPNTITLYFGHPYKYVVTRFDWSGEYYDLPHFKDLQKKFGDRIYEISQSFLKNEYGLKLYRDNWNVPAGDGADASMVLGIVLTVKDGRKMTPPINHFLAVVTFAFGRPSTGLQYPYYTRDPEILTISDGEADLNKEFDRVIGPAIRDELTRVICSKCENGTRPLCQLPPRNPGGFEP